MIVGNLEKYVGGSQSHIHGWVVIFKDVFTRP